MINLGDKNWGVKDSGLLAYKQVGSKYFNKDFDFTRASNGTYVDKNGVLQEIATNVPRIDFSDGVGALLLEPQRSNLLTYSSDFTQSAWNLNSEVNILSNSAVSPNGGLNASKIVPTINDASHYVSRSSQSITGHIYSVFVKSDGYDWILLTSHTTSAPSTRGTYFNIKDGTIGDIGTPTQNPKIEDYGNGWYRCSIDEGSSPSSLFSIHIVNENGGLGFVGDGVSGVLLWGAQREAGTYPTSVIETTTSSVTRIADVANNCGSEQDFNSEEGVLYAEVATLANDGNNAISISDGTNGNRIYVGYNPLGRLDVNVLSGGVYQCVFNYTGVLNPSALNKIAFKYKENDFALWVNGVEVNTDNSGITPIGLNILNFSTASVSVDNFYGKVRSVKYFPEALTDEQLENLTK